MLNTNIRTWGITLILFIALDLILRNYLYLTIDEKNFRPVKKDVLSIELLASKIKHDKGSKVAFIGDSQMYGSAVSSENDTIPGQFRKLMKNGTFHIYNLGGKGYGPGEIFYQLNYLKDERFNTIIYNVSLGWLNRENFTELIGVGALNGLSPLENNDKQRDLIEYSRDLSHNFWYLRGHRYYIGDLIRNKLGIQVIKDKKMKKAYKSWDRPEIVKKLGNTNYINKNINPDNLNMLNKVFNKLDRFASKGTRVIIYISPQNKDLFDKADLWNEEKVNKNVALVEKLAQDHEFECINYIDLVPGENFVDTIHMDKVGNRIIAASLFNYIKLSRRAN